MNVPLPRVLATPTTRRRRALALPFVVTVAVTAGACATGSAAPNSEEPRTDQPEIIVTNPPEAPIGGPIDDPGVDGVDVVSNPPEPVVVANPAPPFDG